MCHNEAQTLAAAINFSSQGQSSRSYIIKIWPLLDGPYTHIPTKLNHRHTHGWTLPKTIPFLQACKVENIIGDKYKMWTWTCDLMPAWVMKVFNTPMSVCCGYPKSRISAKQQHLYVSLTCRQTQTPNIIYNSTHMQTHLHVQQILFNLFNNLQHIWVHPVTTISTDWIQTN